MKMNESTPFKLISVIGGQNNILDEVKPHSQIIIIISNIKT